MRTKFANLLKTALLIGAVMCCFSCKEQKYKYTQDRCIKGHYEERQTSGLSVSKSTGNANRVEEIYVCDEYVTDTLIGSEWVLK